MKMLKVICLFGLLVLAGTVCAQSEESQEHVGDYPIESIILIFEDAINQPAEWNKYVDFVLNDQTFPAKEGNAPHEKMAWNKAVRQWILNNPDKIEQLLAERLKAVEKYHNPRFGIDY